MKYLINYADEKYRKTQKFNSWSGKHIAKFDRIIEYSPKDLDNSFKEKHKNILDKPRGAGLWLWKPYVILKTLRKINDNDFLFYSDSGSFFVKNINHLIKSMEKEENIWVSNIPLIEKQFTKRETLHLMSAEKEEIIETNQIQATFIGIKKCQQSIDFIEKWLDLCCDIKLLCKETDMLEKDYFIDHREDQSVLSILCKQYGIKPHKDPTLFAKIPLKYKHNDKFIFKEPKHNDKYKIIIHLHRGRDVNIGTIIRFFVQIVLPKNLIYSLCKIKKGEL